MTINHSDCDHPRTPSARAKCRRQRAGGAPRLATEKVVDFSTTGTRPPRDDAYGQSPRDRDKECMICGLERIAWRGTEGATGRLLYVGDKCRYYVARAADFKPAE